MSATLTQREALLREALRRIAAEAVVPLELCPDADQPNGWRDLACARIDIARDALAKAGVA